MKVFRAIKGDKIYTFFTVNFRTFQTEYDPIQVLLKHFYGEKISGTGINIDLESLFLRFKTDEYHLIKPLDPPEIWGAGITYEISKERYSEENVAKIGSKSIYQLVYESERPELFFKATSQRCSGPLEPISIRSDSNWTLPEPELGVILSSKGDILGYTILNDVSARDIESENPLYLPQAKIFNGCCAFGPVVVTSDELVDPYSLNITLTIYRYNSIICHKTSSTSKMKRKIEEQVRYLIRNNTIPNGCLLMTGTGIPLGREDALKEGDIVEIQIDQIGRLVTPVLKI